MLAFDGFTRVAEAELPKEIDTIHVAAPTSEFTTRFKLKP
jgi:hypothetical protein